MADDDLDRTLARLAAEQLGLFTTDQARALGATGRLRRTRMESGRWELIKPGVFRIAGAPATWHQDLLAACMATSSTAVASHRAAAKLWELPGFGDETEPEVTVTRHRWHRLAGVHCHETLALPRSDVTRRHTIPVTTPTRTLVDVARYAAPARLEEALDDALRRGLTTLDRLTARVDELSGPGRRGITKIRSLIDARDGAAAVPESVQERRLVRLLARNGLPRPVLQFEICDGSRFVARVDAAYPEQRIAIEYDSYMFHGSRHRHELDLARRNQLQALGWQIFHATAADLRNHGRSDLCGTLARFMRGFASLSDANPRKSDGVASLRVSGGA